MSRLTGSEAQKLLEAYDAIYTSKEEVVEEVVEEETEQLDEGGPGPRVGTTPSVPQRPFMGPLAAGGGRAAIDKLTAKGIDPRKANAMVVAQGEKNLRAKPSATRPTPAPTRQPAPTRPAPTPTRQPAPTRPVAQAKPGPTGVAKPKPTSTATTGFQLAKQGIDLSKPSAASAATPVRRSLAQDLADIRKMRLASQMRQAGQNVVSTQLSSFDPFDAIKGHLIGEGHSEEEALKIMINMTEEERNAIIGQYTVNVADVKGGTQAAKNAQAGMKDKSGNPMYKPGVGVGADFKLKGV